MADNVDPQAAGQSKTDSTIENVPGVVKVEQVSDAAKVPDAIRDPKAYVKAQTEKFARLEAKLRDELAALQTKVETLTSGQETTLATEIASVRSQLEEQIKVANDERLTALRQAAIVKHNVPDELVDFISGTTVEAIEEQAQKLGKPTNAARLGYGTEKSEGTTAKDRHARLYGQGSPFGDGGIVRS